MRRFRRRGSLTGATPRWLFRLTASRSRCWVTEAGMLFGAFARRSATAHRLQADARPRRAHAGDASAAVAVGVGGARQGRAAVIRWKGVADEGAAAVFGAGVVVGADVGRAAVPIEAAHGEPRGAGEVLGAGVAVVARGRLAAAALGAALTLGAGCVVAPRVAPGASTPRARAVRRVLDAHGVAAAVVVGRARAGFRHAHGAHGAHRARFDAHGAS
jgi:hypothetical protein